MPAPETQGLRCSPVRGYLKIARGKGRGHTRADAPGNTPIRLSPERAIQKEGICNWQPFMADSSLVRRARPRRTRPMVRLPKPRQTMTAKYAQAPRELQHRSDYNWFLSPFIPFIGWRCTSCAGVIPAVARMTAGAAILQRAAGEMVPSWRLWDGNP